MKARLDFLAEQDVVEYAVWYHTQSPVSSVRFLQAIEAFREQLSLLPRMYGRVPNPPKGREVLQGMLYGFPFDVVYEILANEIVIVDVSHAKMKRRPWRNRL